MMRVARRALGYILGATALIACPCHLALTLPIALTVLGGTALGAAITAHTGLLVAGATVYFVGVLAAAIYLLNRLSDGKEPSPNSSQKDEASAYTQSHPAQKPRSGVDR